MGGGGGGEVREQAAAQSSTGMSKGERRMAIILNQNTRKRDAAMFEKVFERALELDRGNG